MERQVGFAPTALGFCRPFLWATQALTRYLAFSTGFEPVLNP